MIKLENISKIYSTENNLSVGIRKVNLTFKKGEFVAITGESGSGKSTLLNVLSGIDTYEEGEMYVGGEETSYFSIEDLEDYRNKYVGFIFQNYNIVDSYTVLENVEAALIFQDYDKKRRKEAATKLINRVGLSHRINTKASKLSGGEKQRVVIARALAKDPPIIAADEPTGNLDSATSREIIDLLYEVSKDKLVLIVTHDFEEVKDYATRLIRVYDSEIKEDTILKDVPLDDLPNLFEEPKRKASFKNMFSLSFIDLFSSIKRTLFFLLTFLVLSCSIIVGISMFRYLTNNLGSLYNNDIFRNSDSLRVVLNKKDGSKFSDEEINEIKTKSSVKEVYTKDLSLDYTPYIEYFDDDYLLFYDYDSFIRKVDAISESDLIYGRMPVSNYEIVISYKKSDFIFSEIEIEDLLNKEVDFDNKLKTTIVGIIETEETNSGRNKYVYVTENLFDEYSLENELLDSNISLKKNKDDKENLFTLYWVKYVVNDELEDNKIIYKTHDMMLGLDKNQTYSYIEVENFYKNVLIDKSLNNIELEIDIIGYDDTSYGMWYGSIVEINKSLYDEIVHAANQDSYQLSVFSRNYNETELLRNELRNMGYNAVAPYYDRVDNVVTDVLSTLVNSIYFTIFGIIMFVILLLVYFILLHTIRSRRNDFGILRTIGATRQNIYSLIYIELLISAVISFLVSLILYFIIILTEDGEVLDLFSSVRPLDFVYIFIANILISLGLSYIYSKRAFKRSVRKSLNERSER